MINKTRMINKSDCQDIYFLPKLILKLYFYKNSQFSKKLQRLIFVKFVLFCDILQACQQRRYIASTLASDMERIMESRNSTMKRLTAILHIAKDTYSTPLKLTYLPYERCVYLIVWCVRLLVPNIILS
jgi:hypothetical protein